MSVCRRLLCRSRPRSAPYPVVASEGIVRAGAGAVTSGAPRAGADVADGRAEGASVQVTGCLADRSWCRVIVGGLPGWMSGESLVFPLDGAAVTVASHGDLLEIPVVDGEGQGVAPCAGRAGRRSPRRPPPNEGRARRMASQFAACAVTRGWEPPPRSVSIRSRSDAKAFRMSPESVRPRGSLMRIGSTGLSLTCTS